MSMQKVFDASPTIQRIKAESACGGVRKSVLRLLGKRFGAVPEELVAHLRLITDEETLEGLLDVAYECNNLADFRSAMTLPD